MVDVIINKRLSDYLAQSVHDLSAEHNSLSFWEEYKQWRLSKASVLIDFWEAHRAEYNERCLFSLIDRLGLDWPSFAKISIGELKEVLLEKGRFQQITPLKRAA